MVLYLYSYGLLCSSVCLFLGPAKEVSKRNLVSTPSFRRRRGAASSTPAPILIATSILLLAPPCIEDEKVSLRDANLRPRKSKVVDGEDSVPVVVNLSEVFLEVVVQGIGTTLAEGGIREASEVPTLVGFDIATYFRPE